MMYPAHPGARDRDTSIAAADAMAPQAHRDQERAGRV